MQMDGETSARLMRPRDVAAVLDQSLASVYRKLERGTIPSIRIGDGPRAPIRIPVAEFEAWLAERR
jgi:excisionase family DNA binding protein